jgi:hypothetical protein
MYFDGLIDELSIPTRVKTFAEILEDATSFIVEHCAERQLQEPHPVEYVDICRPDLFAHHGYLSVHQWNARHFRDIDHFQSPDISVCTLAH